MNNNLINQALLLVLKASRELRSKKALLATSALLAVLPFILARNAGAQETPRSFTISPPTIDFNPSPGAHTQGTLKITNGSPEVLTFRTAIQDFVVKDGLGTPDFLPASALSNKYSGASWIEVSPSTVTIEPHQTAELSYIVQVPANARPGGHYAAVVYTPTSALGVKGGGTAVNTSIGSLFYLTVKGNVTEKARIKSFKSPGFYEFGPSSITTEILNLSDIHIKPRGTITLTNMLGGRSDSKPLDEVNVFPGASRTYHGSLGKGFMIGLYHARLTAVYGKTSQPLSATLSFWVFPWRIVLFVLFMLLALFFGLRYWKKGSKVPPPPPPLSGI